MAHVGPKLAPRWPQVGPCWFMLGQVGPKLSPSWPRVCACWPKLAQVGPKLAPRWPQVDPCCFLLGPTWPHAGPSGKVSPSLPKASTKALPLLWILKAVSFWCFFQLALSWQVFQNDLFKRSSPVVLVGWSFLKFHPFSCIARRHSSTSTV